MIDGYTRVLEIAAESDDAAVRDTAVAKLVAHLKNTGRLSMLGDIARELRKIASRRAAMAPVVEVAHQAESTRALAEAAAGGIVATHTHVNHSLIQGFRARGHGILIDRSAKRALTDIYKHVTAH